MTSNGLHRHRSSSTRNGTGQSSSRHPALAAIPLLFPTAAFVPPCPIAQSAAVAQLCKLPAWRGRRLVCAGLQESKVEAVCTATVAEAKVGPAR
eukprot:358288-Chlamydomonas_euryale.AAC.8